MKIAKEFTWEMGHRLPFHKGNCKNLHGHTYKTRIEIEGNPDDNGIVLDYYELDSIVSTILNKLDHGFLVCSEDSELIEVLTKLNSKHVIVNFHSTAENICSYLLVEIKKSGLPSNIKKITARVFETSDTYAENSLIL